MLCLSISHLPEVRYAVSLSGARPRRHRRQQHGCHPFSVLSGLSGAGAPRPFVYAGRLFPEKFRPRHHSALQRRVGLYRRGAGGGISVLAELGRDAGAGSVSGDARNSGAVQGPWRQDRRRLPFRQRRDPPRLPRKRPAGAGSDLRLGASARAPQAQRLAAGADHEGVPARAGSAADAG